VGSVVCGTRPFIAEARRNRKVLGGGMRQAGIIAAPGIIALETMVERLKEDHNNARRLAGGIAQMPGLSIDVATIQTNILYFDLCDQRLNSEEFLKRMRDRGIQFLATGRARFRMVTHYGITVEDIDKTLTALREVMAPYNVSIPKT
jgi:threonine aldolase